MAGNEVFKIAVRSLGSVVDEALEANGLDKSAIDWLIPHQANLRIISATARKLDMPIERVILTVQDHGNTSAASVPLALSQSFPFPTRPQGHLCHLQHPSPCASQALSQLARACSSRSRGAARACRRRMRPGSGRLQH